MLHDLGNVPAGLVTVTIGFPRIHHPFAIVHIGDTEGKIADCSLGLMSLLTTEPCKVSIDTDCDLYSAEVTSWL